MRCVIDQLHTFQFWKDEHGERVKAAVGEVVAACVRFDQASCSMTPILIPEIVRSKILSAEI